jgi:hypothetical protein
MGITLFVWDVYLMFFRAIFWLIIFHHSLLGLICVPSVVRPSRESKLLASATFWLEQKGKVYLEGCECRGRFTYGAVEKTGCRLGVIPVLVFDCVALRCRQGKVSDFRANPLGWGLFALRTLLVESRMVFASFSKKKVALDECGL